MLLAHFLVGNSDAHWGNDAWPGDSEDVFARSDEVVRSMLALPGLSTNLAFVC